MQISPNWVNMVNMLPIMLSQIHPGTPFLWGATAGERLLAETRKRVDLHHGALGEPRIVGLDFTGIRATNGSYLKASLLPWLAGGLFKDDVYVGVLGLTRDVEEEIDELLLYRRLPIYNFSSSKGHKAKLLGSIESFLYCTLQLLTQTTISTAMELMKASNESIGVTGWNNRLAELSRLRLVHRVKFGRTIHYKPLTQEII